ncbi:MAG: lyase family protein, partial [Acidimicrobiia bacterium]
MEDPGLSSEEMVALFGPQGRVRGYLEVEASLAEAQAEAGVIPANAASAIALICRGLEIDAGSLLALGWEQGTLLIPLLEHLGSELGEHRRHLHWETTTQDIVDTALVWRASQAIRILTRDLFDTGHSLSGLADRHRHVWMTGRTFLQAARPTTFGARAALWLDAVTGRLRGLDTTRAGLRVQLGGPVGIRSGMGGRSREVAQRLGERLGLGWGEVPWQSDREPVISLGVTVAGTARTMEKIAADLMALAQTEVGEIAMRPGGSTAMSHKANPVDSMRAVAAARIAVTAATGLLTASPPRLE